MEIQSIQGWVWQDEGGVGGAAPFPLVSQRSVVTSDVAQPALVSSLPAGKSEPHPGCRSVCSVPACINAGITKYRQGQGLAAGIPLPASSSGSRKAGMGELFHLRPYF